MKKVIMLMIAAMLLFSSCSRKAVEPVLEPLMSSEISGERLWERITEESDYTGYRQWTGHDGLQPGQSPHGVWHKVFVNRNLYQAVPADPPVAPYGSIIVKENYDSKKELDKLTVMAKIKGYSPETNDWFWAAIGPEGKILAEGSPAGCLSCHVGMKANDYIIIKNIDEP